MDIESRKKELSDLEYKVTQEKSTEPPFSGEHLAQKGVGVYACKVCGQNLFSSKAKFDSGTGWPSFDQPENQEYVKLIPDESLDISRVEVVCRRCGAHLGHVFSDGPKETTGERYCVNSCSLDFKPKEE